MNHPLESGKFIRSPGGSFVYCIQGPVCRLYDREELPWPCCRLSWKGKEPSWNRVGRRFVPDIATSRCPSYAVIGTDQTGYQWTQILTIYNRKLTPTEKDWWITKKPVNKDYPELLDDLSEGKIGQAS